MIGAHLRGGQATEGRLGRVREDGRVPAIRENTGHGRGENGGRGRRRGRRSIGGCCSCRRAGRRHTNRSELNVLGRSEHSCEQVVTVQNRKRGTLMSSDKEHGDEKLHSARRFVSTRRRLGARTGHATQSVTRRGPSGLPGAITTTSVTRRGPSGLPGAITSSLVVNNLKHSLKNSLKNAHILQGNVAKKSGNWCEVQIKRTVGVWSHFTGNRV